MPGTERSLAAPAREPPKSAPAVSRARSLDPPMCVNPLKMDLDICLSIDYLLF